MRQSIAHLSSPGVECQETLHELNQRYKREWDRAERLQDELNDIKRSRAYRCMCWLRRVAEWWRRPLAIMRPVRRSAKFAMEYLDDQTAPATGTVTILIPFRDHHDLLCDCVRSLRRGSYRHVEIVLLDNASTCPRTLHYVERGQARLEFRVLSYPGPFNFAAICNLGANQSRSDFLLFLNNDMEIATPDWLEQLLHLGNRNDVGIVGGTLLYPDRTLQHAGVFPDVAGVWSHVYRGLPADYRGDREELTHARTVPAVTGACLMIRRRLFLELGGFDESYPLTFNDIDLCLRVRKLGLKVAITPHARLWHYESLTRGYTRIDRSFEFQ